MRVKVPGAGASTGVKAPDFTLPKGDYVFEILKAEPKLSQKSPCMVHSFSMIVIDGPDDEKSGKTTQGRKFNYRCNILEPEHDSYDPNNTISLDELKDLCDAASVEMDADDSYESDDFSGQKVRARLGARMGKDQNGDERPENTIQTQKADDGTVHKWLPDDGVPLARTPSSPKRPSAAKAPASSTKKPGSKKR
jgi:hypothetical protein